MGSVWAARNELTNRDFAIKFLLPEQSKNQDAINRFFLEARACGQIRHASIVDVYDMGQADDGSPFLVMELLEGEGFDQRLARVGRLQPADACRYIASVARGLEEAHTRGLIHRDLKPGNIFFAIDKSGEVFPKVLDFGISKETHGDRFDFVKTSTGAVLGSPAYMSPEQASGEVDIDARADLWALGVILYESLSGNLPFDANNYNALMLAIITQPHRPLTEVAPDVPRALSDLVDTLLEKERHKRVPSAGELASRLERIYLSMTDTPMSAPERASNTMRAASATHQGWLRATGTKGGSRPSPALLVVGAVALVGVIGGGVAVSGRGNAVAVVPAARMGATIHAMAARADAAYMEATAKAQGADAEKRIEEANRRAEKAVEKGKKESRRRSTGKSTGKAPKTVVKPKTAHDPHGGVDDPGF